MTSKFRFQLASVPATEFSLTTTMSLESWKILRDQLKGAPGWVNYPARALIESIDDLVRRAETHWTSESP